MGPKRILLIVEDDVDIRENLAEACKDEGFIAFTAVDGREALEMLAVIPKPCLIITDLMMPVMDGWELIRQLSDRESFAKLPILVMSASSNRKPPPVARFIKKPFDMDRILLEIKDACPECQEQ